MEKLLERITKEIKKAFIAAGYEEKYGAVTLSNRPDLCQYQCNGALAAAKQYKKAPMVIAEEIAVMLEKKEEWKEVQVVKPGFINLNLKEEFLADYLNQMRSSENYGSEKTKHPKTIVIDYGGPNVAKPLHVGHLRSAIIGESIKRMGRFIGHHMIGDVHLGDWGLPIGLIITELKKRKPDLIYFDDTYTGEYPKEAPFTIAELEEIYPYASAYSKEHMEFKEEAKTATVMLQNKKPGYEALWKHILAVSVADLKKNYNRLNVEFELWKKESDAQPYIPDMVEYLKKNGYAKISEGALVVDVKEQEDTKEIPPCMILKSDGAALYNTTDLATIVEREKLFHPDEILYVVDKRQELNFVQVFRCAKKTKLTNEHVKLSFLGFGTMNGKDGKPFKTRDGGVMRLETLMDSIHEAVYQKMSDREMEEEEARKIAEMVGLAALKYGDLSNQASKDYIFDIDRFTAFEGNTGPYIQYTMVRIKSILAKYEKIKTAEEESMTRILAPVSKSETDLMLIASRFSEVVESAFEEKAPHKLCQYVYEIADTFNKFYHENKIIAEEEKTRRASWIHLITLVLGILSICIDLLGFEAPDRM